MPSITYVAPDGTETTVEVPIGQSIMDGSVRNNVPGIIAECGGGCSCATCHVHVDAAWGTKFDAPSDEESELLEFTDAFTPDSRLSCQLIVTGECEGMRVVIPDGNDG